MNAPVLKSVKKKNLREQALETLTAAITTGELAPGTRLIETELAEQLNISRGTLREAIRELHQQGLVIVDTNRGASVRKLNATEVQQIFQVRSALECLAVELLCQQKYRHNLVKVLKERIALMESLRNSRAEEQAEADLAFHYTLCDLTGNSTLTHTWKALEGSIRMTFAWSGLEQTIANMDPTRHSKIVAAIETGDPDLARLELKAHMDEAAQNLIQNVRL